jgi:hypothetical protein
MITFEYAVQYETRNVFTLTNVVMDNVTKDMQIVVDALLQNVQKNIPDPEIAQTVVSEVRQGGEGAFINEVTGSVYSTWANMYWYEHGRQPGGRMPPSDRIIKWIEKHGIKPDPEKTLRSFAFAANWNRTQTVRYVHNAPNRGWVPIDILVEWAKNKGIEPSEEFAIKSLAFAIGREIVRRGIPGKHAFERGLLESQTLIHETFENVIIKTTGI